MATSVLNLRDSLPQEVIWLQLAMAGRYCEYPHWINTRSNGSVLSLGQYSFFIQKWFIADYKNQ